MSTGEPARGAPGGAGAGAGAEDVRADIERTRQQLGETVEALAAKADVKARARQKVSGARDQAAQRVSRLRKQATARAGQPASSGNNRAALAAAAAAAAFTFIAVVLWRRG
jgi:Protein of unknown function (DUF3618)